MLLVFSCQVSKHIISTRMMSITLHSSRAVRLMFYTCIFNSLQFFNEGGDSQMNTLIWYSWLGGIIIGTMIGANMVLDEHCRAGPRNVVITGRYAPSCRSHE